MASISGIGVAVLSPLLVLFACSTAGQQGNASQTNLPGSTWRLVELRSSDDAVGVVRPDDPAKYELRLGKDGDAAARLDCNRGAGRWRSEAAGQITFTPMAMTRAACGAGSLDTRVARELGFVRTYLIEGDRLRLILMADGGSQLWARVP